MILRNGISLREAFLTKAYEKFGRRFDYSLVKYKTSHDPVFIICPDHGKFKQKPCQHLQNKYGCGKCGDVGKGNTKRLNKRHFLRRSKEAHGNIYCYKSSVYYGAQQFIDIRCRTHGIFKMKPIQHYRGRGCPKCFGTPISNTNEFSIKARLKHGKVYRYSKVKYKGAKHRIRITCVKHGDFLQLPNDHLNGAGCPMCATLRRSQGHSKIAIDWINKVAHSKRMKNVQHIGTTGEFTIPGTRYRVDGYHSRTKTVFEFYGDCWHGNPKVYKPSDTCHPMLRNTTARELYRMTMARERSIRKLGYSIVSIWESDYRRDYL